MWVICRSCQRHVHLPNPERTPAFQCRGCRRVQRAPYLEVQRAPQSRGCRRIQRAPYLEASSGFDVARQRAPYLDDVEKVPHVEVPSGRNFARQRMPAMVRATGKKKAVLVGICYRDYKGQSLELSGPTNDVAYMNHFLVNNYKFPEHNILCLTEDTKDSRMLPTRNNIMKSLHWLVQGCGPGDSLVFYFSGHGMQQEDPTGEEEDGFDEMLLPLDFEDRTILDDELHDVLVKPLAPGVRLHAIVDACHSGTILDLPYVLWLSNGNTEWEHHQAFTGTRGGEAFCFSSCDDSQETLDIKSSGLLTRNFIETVDESKGDITYGSLLNNMTTKVYNYRHRPQSKHVAYQEPKLSASYPFDVDDKPFRL